MYEEKYYVFVFILLMCIGLQYETLYYIDGSISGTEYGVMGLSILVALFYMMSAIYCRYRIGKRWEISKKALTLSLLGGLFKVGYLVLQIPIYIIY